MFLVTVTVHNSTELDCRRLSLTDTMDFDSVEPGPIAEFVRQVEDNHRDMFPKGMSYTLPYTEVKIENEEYISIMRGGNNTVITQAA